MRKMPLEKRDISSSRLVLGCMGFGGKWDHSPLSKEEIIKTERAIDAALSSGITMFDHADIYTKGKAEEAFGKVLKTQSNLREKIVIQSKCGIRFAENKIPGRYDFSKKHILDSVDGILKRLQIEYLDILLMHRPDPLMEPEEVAEAFQILKTSGKVQHFGVSNMNTAQVKLLQAFCEEPIIVNQLEMNLKKLDWLNQSVSVNHNEGLSTNFADGMLEYAMLQDIQIQAWSPLANGIYTGKNTKNPSEADLKTKKLVEKMASEKGTTKEAIVLGWLMKHPVKIQPVIGTTNVERIKNCQEAIQQSVNMSREEWYSLYVSARGNILP